MSIVPFPSAGFGAAIPRQSLHDNVVARLRALVLEGELPAGSRVPERVLCERFEVSRTPLREALKVLASEGLIELLPNRGARVVALDAGDIADLFEVMAALEALSGRLACRNMTDAELVLVTELHAAMLGHYQRGELPDYFRANEAIHLAILDAARNPALKATYLGLSVRIRRSRYQAAMSDADWAEAVADHEALLAGLAARDEGAVADLLTRHVLRKRTVVLAEAE